MTAYGRMKIRVLSTPHGALGTESVEDESVVAGELSTPHGALGTSSLSPSPQGRRDFQLHTVH